MSIEKIEANVAFAIEKLGPLSDVPFGLDEDSVAWVEGFIDRQRSRPGFDPDDVEGLTGVLGWFLGACLLAAAGGAWDYSDDNGWGVRFPNGCLAYPFAKVRKQFRNGTEGGDSISSFYRVAIDVVAGGKLGG
ncbi:hypothetical protein [Microbispora amethystogenes]|uniref:Uncharacterized protein n=1 Tax=Microbispora amethystogenes TaxID=1427754 RepID=A0ABQ4FQ84_9ACTN|nr:hypothetical protein [Microbispora amethystogenes]GIH36982.1 hypothetical protein Mam01_71460 [Microbispora amethystogenes]